MARGDGLRPLPAVGDANSRRQALMLTKWAKGVVDGKIPTRGVRESEHKPGASGYLACVFSHHALCFSRAQSHFAPL